MGLSCSRVLEMLVDCLHTNPIFIFIYTRVRVNGRRRLTSFLFESISSLPLVKSIRYAFEVRVLHKNEATSSLVQKYSLFSIFYELWGLLFPASITTRFPHGSWS